MKFCFFGNVSGAFSGQTAGGGELQIALLAKALALKGHEVVIIDPVAKKSFLSAEGVNIINVPGWNDGIKFIRLFWYRIPALKKLFTDQKADFYYIRMRSYLHIIPYWASRKNRAKFIQAVASGVDVLGFWGKFKYQYKANFNLFRYLTLELPNDLVYNYLLKRSDYIVLQHAGQQLKVNSFKAKIEIFSNIFDFDNIAGIRKNSGKYFIIPGALNMLKGVNNLYRLIDILDNKIPIIIVGQPTDNKSRKIYKRLKQKENVMLKGRLNQQETIQLIANSKAVINTSNFEGFPNIFLEAWATGIPVISLKVNPGNIFNKYDLGIFCDGDLYKMKKFIESGCNDKFDKEKLISYVSEFHDFNTAGDRFLKILNN